MLRGGRRDAWGPPPALASRPRDARRDVRVTVVMPTWRRAEHVGEAISAVLGQTFGDFELHVRDDGAGDDGTEDAVRRAAAGDRRVRYARNERRLGLGGNVNRLVEGAPGTIIAIAHDHDVVAPRWLETLVGLLDRHPSALYAHCGFELVDATGRLTGERIVGDWPELTAGRAWLAYELESFEVRVAGLSAVRRSAFERHGLLRPELAIADVELWLRLAAQGDVAYAAGPLARVRHRERGHYLEVDPWPLLAALFDMHRLHVEREYSGLERVMRRARLDVRADAVLLGQLRLGRRRGERQPFGAARTLLGRSAGPVGRLLASLRP
jgi:glycosyltransferase involved in cell wall biosynthesis